MPVKIIKSKPKVQPPSVPRATDEARALASAPTVPGRMEVDTSSGEVVMRHDVPDFDDMVKDKDPVKVLAEYDRLIKHFSGMPEKYPSAKQWDKDLWGRCLKPIERDRAAYIEWAKKNKIKLPKGVK